MRGEQPLEAGPAGVRRVARRQWRCTA
jgi:hypothetical protein